MFVLRLVTTHRWKCLTGFARAFGGRVDVVRKSVRREGGQKAVRAGGGSRIRRHVLVPVSNRAPGGD